MGVDVLDNANTVVIRNKDEDVNLYFYGEFLSGAYGVSFDVTYDPSILRWNTTAGVMSDYSILEEDGAADVAKNAWLQDNQQGTVVVSVTRYRGGNGGDVGYGSGGSNNRGLMVGLIFKTIGLGATNLTIANNNIYDKDGDTIASYTWEYNEAIRVIENRERNEL